MERSPVTWVFVKPIAQSAEANAKLSYQTCVPPECEAITERRLIMDCLTGAP